jgi:hypothetical protein
VIAQGQTALDADGTFRIRFTRRPTSASERTPPAVTYRYEAVAEATDEGGETRSDTRSFRLGFVSVEASVALATEFFRESVPGELTITRSDLDGVPRPGKGAWRLTEIVQPPKTLLPAEMPAPASREGEGDHDPYATPGDRLRPRWDSSFDLGAALRGWPDGRERAHGEVLHDAMGQAGVKLPPSPRARGAPLRDDRRVRRAIRRRDFLVAGRAHSGPSPGRAAERPSAGGRTDRASSWARRFRPDRLRRNSARRPRGVSIAIVAEGVLRSVTEDSRGGFAVRLARSSHQFVALARASSSVSTKASNEFAMFRDKIRPGAKETEARRWARAVGRGFKTAELLAYVRPY